MVGVHLEVGVVDRAVAHQEAEVRQVVVETLTTTVETEVIETGQKETLKIRSEPNAYDVDGMTTKPVIQTVQRLRSSVICVFPSHIITRTVT